MSLSKIGMQLTILSTFGLSLSFPAFAQWSPQGIQFISQFNDGALVCQAIAGTDVPSLANCPIDYMRGGGYMETLLGTIGIIVHTGGLYVGYPGEQKIDLPLPKHFFQSPDGAAGSLELSFWQPHIANPSQAPLAVYLPGIFQDAKMAHSYRAVELLLKNGYQVLLIPNPLSPSYLRQFPVASPGSFQAEAEIVLAVIAWAKQNLVAPDATVNVVGASYGAFLGAVLTGLIETHPEVSTLINGQVTLLAMPLDMNATIRVLDSHIDSSLSLSLKGYSLDQFGAAFHTGLENLVSWMQFHFRQRGQLGFKAVNYAESVAEIYRTFDTEKQADLDQIRFRWIINNLEPENIAFYGPAPYNDVKPTAGYWLNRALNAGFNQIRILEADDDLLNDPKEYSTLPAAMRDPTHLLIRASGGHVGYIEQQMFDDFVRLEFAGHK